MQTKTHSGVVRRVFFANPEAPFMAGILQSKEHGEIRFSGKFAASVGDQVEMTGVWNVHPKFGRQFEASTGVAKMDESPEALVHMLASRREFKGLGEHRARKVVEAAMSLSVDGELASALIAYPDDIARRSGVDVRIVKNAAEVWGAKKGHFDALAQLADQGWSNAQAAKIVAKLGENAPSIVKSDPYMLIGKIGRFGFRTVDVVARRLGTSATDPMRIQSGIAYCLDRIADDGNTWTTRDGLTDAAIKELVPDTLDGEDMIRASIQAMIDSGLICVDFSPTGVEMVADSRLASIELGVFDRLLDGLGDCTLGELPISGPRADAVMPTLNDGQRRAALGFAMNRYGVISGGAGVGKTYTMRAICEVAEENGLRVELCAPTGKAARKLAHATERHAQTIHRLLEPRFDEDCGDFRFTRGARNPVDADLVVVDEVSMVDVRLMHSLLIALRPDCRLLLVGDHHQIPSVGPGAILRDLLSASHRYPDSVHVLTEIVRQAGVLAKNTTALLDGVVVALQSPSWGFQRTERGHEEGAAAMSAVLIDSLVSSPTPLEPFNRPIDFAWDVQVLTPMRKGPLGTYALNVHLQRLRQRMLGNDPPEPTPEGKPPKPLVGDRVIWTQNDYELDLFNGTQAIVTAFPKGGAMQLFTEDGREVLVPAGKRSNVEVAYAMTIHKAQGSEWPCVILVCSSSHLIMHDRNLLYTGASRASESLTLLGDAAGLSRFAKTKRSAARQTFGSLLVLGWRPTSRDLTRDFASSDWDRIVDAE